MNALVNLALFGWIPLSIAVFAIFEMRIATLVTVIGGWLLLPVASVDVPGLPEYTKSVAVALGTLSGLLLFARRPFAGLRPGPHDLAALAWCLVPAASSLANDHGIYDAAAAALSRSLDWGIPYIIGRAVFRDLAGIELLAKGVFVGGLVYIPLCLYEVRMSPQLHRMVYGFAQHDFAQTVRFEGYRPMVFMDHGLMVALWLAVATTAGFTLWRQGAMRILARVPVVALLLALAATSILCKSTGALVLLAAGLATLTAVRSLRSNVPLYVLLGLPVLFVFARVGLNWEARGPIALITQYAPERALSLEFRITCERIVLSQLWHHPWLGSSTWGVREAFHEPFLRMALDSAWLITMSATGLIGLALFFWVHLAPVFTLLRRVPARELLERRMAGALALAIGLLLFVCDCMFNSMMNLVYFVVLGSVTSVAAATVPQRADPPMRAVRRRLGSGRAVHGLA